MLAADFHRHVVVVSSSVLLARLCRARHTRVLLHLGRVPSCVNVPMLNSFHILFFFLHVAPPLFGFGGCGVAKCHRR